MSNRLRGKLAAVSGLTAVAATAGMLLAASPVSAAAPGCSPGYHCVSEYRYGESAQYSFFNSDRNFSDNYFPGTGRSVDNNTWGAANSSTGNYESHYYDGYDYSGGLVFCVNPSSYVYELAAGHKDRASSLQLRPRTSIRCY